MSIISSAFKFCKTGIDLLGGSGCFILLFIISYGLKIIYDYETC